MSERPAAFFDLDKTLLLIDSGTSWMKFLRRRGEVGRLDMLRLVYWATMYKAAVLDMESLATRLVADLAGDSEYEMLEKCRVWYRAEVAHQVAPKALSALHEHRSQGHEVVLLTASTQFVADVICRDLEIKHSLCSRLEVEDGRFTGRLSQLCFGHHKVKLAEKLADEHGIDLGASYFYSDSYNDRPMLERVGHPVAVNPDARLLRHARRRNWPVESWARRSGFLSRAR